MLVNTMEPEASQTVLEFEQVFLSFGSKPALAGISFELLHGETKIVLGAAGSGKSVLLKLALGLLKPDSGRILVHGQEISSLSEEDLYLVRRRFGMVFQEGALFDSLTVGENVALALERLSYLGPEGVEQRVREALRFVELEHTVEQYPAELSGGMRRRVAIARALVSEPEIVLYDSPTAGLDPITANRIVTLIIKRRDVRKASSLLVTHRLQDAFEMASYYFDPAQDQLRPLGENGGSRESHTRFLVLREGVIAFHGNLAALRAQRDPYLQKFLA
jgi:phospholipid/cholesterol/gamma-HCH transport system ATP-binding protein